jgi:predicted ArsR family transcriptional regulator
MPAFSPGATDWSVLEVLEAHGSLAYEQIAAHLQERPDAVPSVLQSLRARDLVEVLVFGVHAEQMLMSSAAYWRLTEKGREELGRRRFT